MTYPSLIPIIILYLTWLGRVVAVESRPRLSDYDSSAYNGCDSHSDTFVPVTQGCHVHPFPFPFIPDRQTSSSASFGAKTRSGSLAKFDPLNRTINRLCQKFMIVAAKAGHIRVVGRFRFWLAEIWLGFRHRFCHLKSI